MNENLKLIIRKYEENGARIIIRPSGTEPILRVMVETKNEKKSKEILNKLMQNIKSN